VPLLVKIYKLLINELNNQIEESKDENGEEYEDYDDEDEEDEEDDECVDDTIQGANNIEIDQEDENLNKYLNRLDCKLLFFVVVFVCKLINFVFSV
jgi:hypothetical protein